MLLKLLDNIKSWPELEAGIASLPSEQERGEAFEQFCKPFFLLDPVFQFKEVYRQTEIPPSILEQLGYPGRQDIGIDGVASTIDGKLFAYQAKFRSDRSNTPTLRELSTFFTVSDRADWRICITNANSLPSAINDRTKQSRILADRLDQLDSDFFNRLRIYLKEQRVLPPERKGPHETQQEAIDAALAHFKEQSRGQLILPCGAGKTRAAMWIAEKTCCSNILVLVPSLSLLSQTLREWAVNTSIRPFRYLCLCSDSTVDLGNDSPIEHRYELDVPVTTDVERVAEFLTNNLSSPSIIFSTYQSSKVLSEAVLKTSTVFDMAIFDEAHRTTGTTVGVWSLALRDEKIPIKKRLFMTATPRIYAPHITKKAKEEDVLICSMDDPTVYGKPFYEMSFGAAIEREHITDYKIVVICVTDSEVREIIQSGGRVITDDENEWDAKAFAKRVALAKGMKAYGLRKVFTFHARVNGAKAFTDTKTPYGIGQVFKMLENTPHPDPLPQGAREHSFISPPLAGGDEGEGAKGKIKFFHVNGTMPSGVRNSIMKEFKEAKIGIMSNARCLTEGVDLPAVDTVAFIDPKKSLIDIVQATGRAMRKAEWKEKGYIFIPVVVAEDSDLESIIESSDFNAVWQVLQAMVDQDHRLEDMVSNLRVMQGKGEEGTQTWKDAMAAYSDKVEFYNLPSKIDKAKFISTLHTKTVEVVGKSWDYGYGATLRYKEEFGTPNAVQNYRTQDGFSLGMWQRGQRKNYKLERQPLDRFQKLSSIGFTWSVFDEAFEKGLQESIRYKNKFGTPNAPLRYITDEGFKLGSWQSSKKTACKKGTLPADKVKRLEEIGFTWNQLDEVFEQGLHETLQYKEKYGIPNAHRNYNSPNGFNLGSWQHVMMRCYKKGKLSQDRVRRLEEIGFVWDRFDHAFDMGYGETLKYKEKFGTSNAPNRYKTPEGFPLGHWQQRKRQDYKKGKLLSDKINRLEETGFTWDIVAEGFEKGFQETVKYLRQFGTPNAPRLYKTADGFNLGTWQDSQRQAYKTGKLPSDKSTKLEDIGFVWNKLDNVFECGLQHTIKYKEEFDTPNAPIRYETPSGFKLGIWQSHKRQAFKKGKLSLDKIRRLEEIGFTWKIKDVKKDG